MDPIQQVTEWYQTYLGRDPDPGGLQAYTEALSGGADPGQLVASITGSPEARAQVSAGTATPATQQASTLQQLDYAPTAAPNLQQQQVIDLYQQFLGRNPDPASLSNDVNLLKSNPAAYGWLVDNVANSPEAKQANSSAWAGCPTETPAHSASPSIRQW